MNSSYIFLFLVIVLLFCNNMENYENIYQKNDILPDEPDNKQFYACGHTKFKQDENYPFEKYPNSNYKINPNSIKKPLKGTYSSFIDVNKIRTYDHFYHAPICEDTYPFNTDVNSQFRRIARFNSQLLNEYENNISDILKEEKRKDAHDLRNPFYLYGSPEYIQNKITYEDDIQDIFLKIKLEKPLHHEDDSHLDNFVSRYDN